MPEIKITIDQDVYDAIIALELDQEKICRLALVSEISDGKERLAGKILREKTLAELKQIIEG